MELSFLGTFVPGNEIESSMELSFLGTKVPALELSLPGMKVPRN